MVIKGEGKVAWRSSATVKSSIPAMNRSVLPRYGSSGGTGTCRLDLHPLSGREYFLDPEKAVSTVSAPILPSTDSSRRLGFDGVADDRRIAQPCACCGSG